MTRLKWLLAAFVCLLTLCSCKTTPNPHANQNLLQETWMQTINLNPTVWTRNADRWFFLGEPNATEQDARLAPHDKAISITAVNVSQFTNIHLRGCFQVQIAGGEARNSVYILGPNEAARQISVRVEGDTVIVSEPEDPKKGFANLKNVIVRIGVSNLNYLKVSGMVNVEGRMLVSNSMTIDSYNQESVLLDGRINLVKVNNGGRGTVSVLNAYTPCLTVINRSSGTVNVSGRVGIRTISNLTNGRVHIIGADSRSLMINACGDSHTSVAGYADLKRLNATGNACVHLYWVNSRAATVFLNKNARVGLAGRVGNLDVYVADNARFGGQYLHATNVYVQTRNNAHANVSGSRRIFASASDNSSIYYFGSPNNVSRNTADLGIVVPVWGASSALPRPAYAPIFMTSVNRPPGMVKTYRQ